MTKDKSSKPFEDKENSVSKSSRDQHVNLEKVKIKEASEKKSKKEQIKTLRENMENCRQDMLRIIDFAIGKKKLPKTSVYRAKPKLHTAEEDGQLLWIINDLCKRIIKLRREHSQLLGLNP